MRRWPGGVAASATAVAVVLGVSGCGGDSHKSDNYKSYVKIISVMAASQVDATVTGRFTNPEKDRAVGATVTLDLKVRAGGTCKGGAGTPGAGDAGTGSALDSVPPGTTVVFEMNCTGYLPADPSPSLAHVESVTIGDPAPQTG